MTERLYALAHGPQDAPIVFYVGKTSRPLEHRLKEHQTGVSDQNNAKPAYEYARHFDDWYMLDLGSTDDGLTETDFVKQFTLDGHPIQNSNAGNSVIAKKRSKNPVSAEFRKQNAEADERIDRAALAERASSRRNYLHNKAQSLTKPEITRQRITGALPTADDLQACNWIEGPVELMPFKKLPKNLTGISLIYTKWGDFSIFVATKKGKLATYIKNTRTVEANCYHASWGFGPSDLPGICKTLEGEIHRAIWSPVSSFRSYQC